jgi:hypothetical protein
MNREADVGQDRRAAERLRESFDLNQLLHRLPSSTGLLVRGMVEATAPALDPAHTREPVRGHSDGSLFDS